MDASAVLKQIILTLEAERPTAVTALEWTVKLLPKMSPEMDGVAVAVESTPCFKSGLTSWIVETVYGQGAFLANTSVHSARLLKISALGTFSNEDCKGRDNYDHTRICQYSYLCSGRFGGGVYRFCKL